MDQLLIICGLMLTISWISNQKEKYYYEEGLGIKDTDILLSDLFSVICDTEEIPPSVLERFPNISKKQYESATRLIELLLTSLEWNSTDSMVENSGTVNKDEMDHLLSVYRKKLSLYRKDPEDFLGYDPDQ